MTGAESAMYELDVIEEENGGTGGLGVVFSLLVVGVWVAESWEEVETVVKAGG